MGERRSGFTLIELLIVVAIIAILAAVAVPNFLEAQTRAKVSRVKADMRSIAAAIESYAVDHGRYPAPDGITGGPIDLMSPPTFFEVKMPRAITTPVAYFSRIIDDTFWNLDPAEHYRPYHFSPRWYATLDQGQGYDGALEFDAFHFSNFFRVSEAVQWYLLSHGPDVDHDAGPSGGGVPGQPGHITGEGVAPYDPTNGTRSSGDLTLWGPSAGFPS